MPRVEPTAPFEEPLLVAPTGRTRSRLALGSLLVLGLAMVGVVAVVITTTHGHSGSHGDDHKNDDAPTPRQEIEHSNLTEAFAAWHEIYKPDSMYQSGQQMQSKIKIFGENMAKVDAHNARYAKGEVSFNMTLGPFADMTSEQFVNRFLVKLPPSDPSLPIMPDLEETLGGTAHKDANIDYRSGSKKWVSKVKDQGSCGSCWAFSAAGAIEGAWAKAGKGLINVSPQQMVDCDRKSEGCDGGLPSTAIKLVAAKGFATEKQYRYQGTDYLKCKAQKYSNKGMVHGPVKVPQSDTKLYTALQTHGPVSVAIDATVLQHYHSGVLSSGRNDVPELNHAVLLVGMTANAWIVKNSWDTDWGEKGYFRLKRMSGVGTLGINEEAVYATVK